MLKYSPMTSKILLVRKEWKRIYVGMYIPTGYYHTNVLRPWTSFRATKYCFFSTRRYCGYNAVSAKEMVHYFCNVQEGGEY